MKYMLLIYGPAELPDVTVEEERADMQAWFDYTDAMDDAGVMLGSEALEGTETATTVRVRNDETVLTDGPFAETKEVLGGYYLIEVDDIDEAISWASRSPAALYGSMEVRPVWDVPDQD